MESIVRNVTDLESAQRQWIEMALGHRIGSNDRVVIMIVGEDTLPEDSLRARAVDDLRDLCEKGTRHREVLGVAVEEADHLVDEAIAQVRKRTS